MNPSNNQTAGVPVPTQVNGQSSAPAMPEINLPPATQNPSAPAPQAPAPQLVPMATVPLPPQTSTASMSSSSPAAVGFQVADDKDVIEPEWVHKAKAIVDSTKEDPYKQSEELTVFKADYMQKRYNKTVKLK